MPTKALAEETEVLREGPFYAEGSIWERMATYDPGDCWRVWAKWSSGDDLTLSSREDVDRLIALLQKVRERIRTDEALAEDRAALVRSRG
jgi:hypothetical protein